jgi:glycosyltransferase involved in cell wall biosynthesis
MAERPKPRVLIFIVAYNAEQTIASVLRRVPAALADPYEVEVLIVDDASGDSTFEKSHHASRQPHCPFPVHVLFNPVNQGYGGNQKIGYHYAIEGGYDYVALLHGDGQYAPESLPSLLEPLRKGEAAAVFGSRMLAGTNALQGGMPLYKFVGNRILTWIENRLLRSQLSEFHSGYRVYSVAALKAVPFERNSNDFHFDTEIIIQFLIARLRIVEAPIPTYYGDEICYVNGIKYARNVVLAALKARLQELSLFYDRKYDCAPGNAVAHYRLKLDYASPHTFTLDRIPMRSRVLDLGCAGGYMGAELRRRKLCTVTGVDAVPPAGGAGLDEFHLWDLNAGVPELPSSQYDFVLLLDVLEHLARPESFLEQLKHWLDRGSPAEGGPPEVIISTGNVAFLVTRLMLLLGQFNYGKCGILDLTHTRLFTFASLRRALVQAGFKIVEVKGVPAPFPLAIGENFVSRLLLRFNRLLIRVSRNLFAYQIFTRVTPAPSLGSLLSSAREKSRKRAEELDVAAAS